MINRTDMPCKAPSGSDGECVRIKNCPTLMGLYSQRTRTKEENERLTQASCGADGSTPKVCCEHSCYTPEGLLGKCIDIHDCEHVVQMIKQPLSKEAIFYLQSSRCNGATQYSVCCGPVVTGYDQSYCEKQDFIHPPRPMSGCCGIDINDDEMIGGQIARKEQYPWIVLIEYEARDLKINTFCGGSLISSRYVLTAAHCLIGSVLDGGTPKNIRLGEYDTSNEGRDCTVDFADDLDCNEPTVTIPIEETIVHPQYDLITKSNDIGLVRMRDNAPFTDFIRPICLPTNDVTEEPPHRFRLVAAGWGEYNVTMKRSNLKLQVTLPLVDRQTCQRAYSVRGRRTNITRKQICAGGVKDKDICIGDSGGPLMYQNVKRYELIGIASFGTKPCGTRSVPGVYTKVFRYMEWIVNNIKL
ncbi:phenoloxidase-activating enzyme-like [Amyelois transitella]|uniref:phenoloxidase-activating enzyme-like n=1 Tax=Amyelois transitella TaxID=680683 RepID=UPI00298F492C|nr:phenoloxidase-activating enzyme-like [Amyelois transitella]